MVQESLYFHYYKSIQLEDEVVINEYCLQQQEAIQEVLVEQMLENQHDYKLLCQKQKKMESCLIDRQSVECELSEGRF